MTASSAGAGRRARFNPLVLATLAMILCLAGAFAFYGLDARRRALAAGEKLIDALSLTVEDQAHRALSAAALALEVIGDAGPEILFDPDGADLPAAPRALRHDPLIHGVAVIDVSGVIHASNVAPRDVGADLSGLDFFKNLQRDVPNNQLSVGAPLPGRAFADRNGGDGFIPAARPIFDDSGRFRGATVAMISLAALRNQHRAVVEGYGAAVSLHRLDGQALLGGAGAALTQFPPPRERGVIYAPARPNGPPGGQLASFRVLRAWPLVVSVALPLDSVLSEWVRDVSVAAALTFGACGLVAAALLALRRKQQELQEQEAAAIASRLDLEEAIGAVSDGFCRFDAEGRLTLANQAFRDMIPLLSDLAVPGVHYADLLRAGAERCVYVEASGWIDAWLSDRIARFAAPDAPYEEPLSDGRWIRVHDRRTADGGVVGLRIDVTEQKARERQMVVAREAADRANAAKTRFLAQMSHEIRTPMNGVIGMTGLLIDTPLSAEQQEMVRTIQDSADALLQLINDILDVSRLEAGKLTLVDGAFDLADTLDSVIALVSLAAVRKGVPIFVDIRPNTPLWLWGDQGRLRQILLNLLSNAVKFTESGRIDVSAAVLRPGWMELAVRDTGCGVPSEAMPRLFRSFEQGDADTHQRFGGSGLGLAICRRLAQLMGGMVGVDSSPGVGSRFWVRLPIRIPDAPRPPKVDPTPPRLIHSAAGALARPLRILAAEDNQTNQRVLRGVLEKLGHHCDIVADGREAVEAAAIAPYDLVLMDVQMPVMDGVEATRAIRALAGPAAQTPILALTANVMAGDEGRYRAAGMNGLLPKPLRPDALARALASFAPEATPPAETGVPEAEPETTPEAEPETPPEAEPETPPPAAPNSPDDGLIQVDRPALKELFDAVGGAGVLSVMEDYRLDVAARLAELEEALNADHGPPARRALHALASLYATFGLTTLAKTSRAAENAGRSGEVEEMIRGARRVLVADAAAQAQLDAVLLTMIKEQTPQGG